MGERVFNGFCAGTRVLVVADAGAEPADGLALDLYDSGAVITRCADASAATAQMEDCRAAFDVVLIEGGEHALPLLHALHARRPEWAVLVIAERPSPQLLRELHRCGAGYLSRDAASGALMFALLSACSLPVPNMLRLVAHGRAIWRLSRQQARLLYYNLWGYSNQEIADALELSVHTVHEYQRELRRRTGAQTKAEYLRRLLEHSGHRPHDRDALPWR